MDGIHELGKILDEMLDEKLKTVYLKLDKMAERLDRIDLKLDIVKGNLDFSSNKQKITELETEVLAHIDSCSRRFNVSDRMYLQLKKKLEAVERIYGSLLEDAEVKEEDKVEHKDFMAMLKEARASMNEKKGGENNMDKDVKELCLEIIREQRHIQNRLDTMNYTINQNSKNIEKIIQKITDLEGAVLSHGDYCEERFEYIDKRWLALKQEVALYKCRKEDSFFHEENQVQPRKAADDIDSGEGKPNKIMELDDDKNVNEDK